MQCVSNINVDNSKCLKPCSGLIVTSLSKEDSNKEFENLNSIIEDYNIYKKITQYPAGFDTYGRFRKDLYIHPDTKTITFYS